MNTAYRSKLAENLASIIPAFHQKFIHEIPFPVPPNHFLTLIRLHDYGTQTITELSERLLISKQQMSPIIEKLFNSGYVDRVQDAKDRRSVKISISDLGYKILESHHHHMVALLEKKITHLKDKEVQELSEKLKTFLNLFNKLP